MAKTAKIDTVSPVETEAFSPALAAVETEATEETAKPNNIFDKAASDANKRLAEKAAAIAEARQALAEASDYYRDSKGSNSVAEAAADKGATALLMAQCNGLIGSAEVTATLGDIFGYVLKKDGTPGKTPEGKGADIRKRIVRAFSAYEYSFGRDGGDFFKGLPNEEVFAVVSNLIGGETSIWTAYEQFAEIRRNHLVKVEAAFDPKRITAIVEGLCSDDAADKVKANPALIAAYGALLQRLEEIGKLED